MSWLHIPEEVGNKIEKICNEYFSYRSLCAGCPLKEPCGYENDPNKSSNENCRIFETGVAAKLAEIEKDEKK